jgi:hypothetical protein
VAAARRNWRPTKVKQQVDSAKTQSIKKAFRQTDRQERIVAAWNSS